MPHSAKMLWSTGGQGKKQLKVSVYTQGMAYIKENIIKMEPNKSLYNIIILKLS